MKLFTLITAFLLSLNITIASDSDHPLSKIIGNNIDLSVKGHTIAGRVDDKLIFGDVSADGHKTSKVVIKNDHGVIETTFANTDGVWGGVILTEGKSSEIKFISLDREIPAYVISVNGKEYTVRVESEDFQNNHFIKPTYILELDDQEVRAQMLDGQACYMYSLHLIFMIFGTYLI